MPDICHQFLCASLRLDYEHQQSLLQHPRWCWDKLFQAANENAVLATVAGRMQSEPLSLPSEVSNFLFAVLCLNRERNSVILEEASAVARLLNTVGIEPVLLKGIAYLVTGVYPDPATRFLTDVDLLIPKAQLPLAVEVLLENGYVSDETDQFGGFRHHHPALRRPGSVSIELHHTLGLGKIASVLPAEEMLRESLPCDFNGARARVPCPEHMMAHLVLHSQMVHPYNERIWPPLRAINDFVQLERCFAGQIEWAAFEARFRESGEYGLLALHLLDISRTLGLDPPFTIRLTPFTRCRQLRRKMLRRFPSMRYLDPVYMYSTLLTRRLRILSNTLRTPGGAKFLVSQLLRPPVYLRFVTDLLEGRGH